MRRVQRAKVGRDIAKMAMPRPGHATRVRVAASLPRHLAAEGRRLRRGAGIPARAEDITRDCPELAEGMATPRFGCRPAALCLSVSARVRLSFLTFGGNGGRLAVQALEKTIQEFG